jgi:murein DD-endopeptidase MepM/ murein hydrolase activator NlpD
VAAAKPAPAKKRATAKPATAKPATAKPATAKPATAKPATAKPATAKPATVKPATAKPVAAETPASAPARRPRPTPRPRPVAPAAAAPEIVLDAERPSDVVVADVEPNVHSGRRRRILAALRHRPALHLAATLVAALAVTGVYAGPAAQADSAGQPSHSMSVAAELGISSQQTVTAPDAADADQLAELTASRATRESEQAAAVQVQQQADAAAVEAARPKAILPVNGARLTTCFCMRWGTMHWGIDLAAPMGTPEYAAMDGVVLEAGPASGFGLAVYIQHANGDVTVYGHMEQILVTAGQVVKAGDTIALLGNRGQSTGPHLHFEVHSGGIEGTKIDPIPWLQERGVQVG